MSEKTGKQTASGEMLTDESVKKLLPDRPDDANKGTFGKAMIVAGSINYIGAAALATEGAMRVGAGLVTLGCAGDLLPMLSAKLTECTFLLLPSDMGSVTSHAADKLRASLEDYTALLVGCGLGQDRETAGFLRELLSNQEVAPKAARAFGFGARHTEDVSEEEKSEKKGEMPPMVLDGDALNILSEWEDWHTHLPANTILTPHPGEMARLTGQTVEEVQADRPTLARECAQKWDCVVVLKGAATIIAEPGGKLYVSPFSNPALATAGTGDVLAGAIAGLLAQGLSPSEAACAGVYLHGMAGEMMREEYGVSGGLAGELPVLLARAQKRLRDVMRDA